MHELLFGDVPLSQWAGEANANEEEPWLSFGRARECSATGRPGQAVEALQQIVAMPDLESRHYLQAWCFLREAGVLPGGDVAKDVLGVVVEVSLRKGLDTLAAYADGTGRYINCGGKMISGTRRIRAYATRSPVFCERDKRPLR